MNPNYEQSARFGYQIFFLYKDVVIIIIMYFFFLHLTQERKVYFVAMKRDILKHVYLYIFFCLRLYVYFVQNV